MSDYRFDERFAFSEGERDRVFAIAREQLGAVDIKRASEQDDRRGVDFWAIVPNRPNIAIDVKRRSKDWPDVDIETWSNAEQGKPGWAADRSKITDYVLWLWPSRYLFVSYPQLRAALLRHMPEWERLYPQRGRAGRVRHTSTERKYHTKNVYVPEAVLLDALYPELQAVHLVPPKDVWRVLPQRCFTCGAAPTDRFADGSPKYSCSHPAVPLEPPMERTA